MATGEGGLPDKETRPLARSSALRFRFHSWTKSLLKLANVREALKLLDEKMQEDLTSKHSGRARKPTPKQAALFQEHKDELERMKQRAVQRKPIRVYAKPPVAKPKSSKGHTLTVRTRETSTEVQTTNVSMQITRRSTTVRVNMRGSASPTSSEGSPRGDSPPPNPPRQFPPPSPPKPRPSNNRRPRCMQGGTMNRNGNGSCTMTANDDDGPKEVVLQLKSTMEMAGSPPSEHGSPTANDDNEDDLMVLEAIGDPPERFVLGDEDENPIDGGKEYSLDALDNMGTRYQHAVSWWFFEEEETISAELLQAHPWLGEWARKPITFH